MEWLASFSSLLNNPYRFLRKLDQEIASNIGGLLRLLPARKLFRPHLRIGSHDRAASEHKRQSHELWYLSISHIRDE